MPVNEKAERSRQETAVFFCSLSLRTGRSTYAAGSASLRALRCVGMPPPNGRGNCCAQHLPVPWPAACRRMRGERHNLGCQSLWVMPHQMQSNIRARPLWARIRVQGCGVRPCHEIGKIERRVGHRQILHHRIRAVLRIQGQDILRQRPIVQHHGLDRATKIGCEQREMLPGRIAVSLPGLGHEVSPHKYTGPDWQSAPPGRRHARAPQSSP